MYIKYSINTSHSQFFNQLFAGRNLPAIFGDVLASLLNSTVTTFEASPVLTIIEETLISKMCKLVGFNNGDGIFVSGGSFANIVAILCARHKKLKNVKNQGLSKSKQLIMFVSDQAHYSLLNAANVAGIGLENVIKIKTDLSGKIILADLERKISLSIQKKQEPFLIVSTAGTCTVGAFEGITEIVAISSKYNLWLHIDACFGGSVILSSKYKNLLDGCFAADSISWDAHKAMCIPLVCSTLLVRESSWLPAVCDTSNADYILHSDKNMAHNIGRKTIQCGRRSDALKLWCAWKILGDEGYDLQITQLIDLARYASEIVMGSLNLELYMSPQSFIVCFRYKTNLRIDHNAFNKTLRSKLLESRQSFVNYVTLSGILYLRLAIVNPHIEEQDIDKFFANVEREAQSLIQSMAGEI